MESQTKILGLRLIPNYEIILHSQNEVQQLIKKGIVSSEVEKYNEQLQKFLIPHTLAENKASCGHLESNLGKDLSQTQKILILNNKFANKAEILLKVPTAERLGQKELKSIIEHRKKTA